MTDINRLITISLKHVPFDGWNKKTFKMACDEAGISNVEGKLLFPRGSIDLMLTFIKKDDEEMVKLVVNDKNLEKKYRDRITDAMLTRIRLADENKEAMRKALSLLSLPHMIPDNAAMVWNLSDAIWNSLGDTSKDINWYTKRVTLGTVYSSTLLYWLGDESKNILKTEEFLHRRIDDVMEFEAVKVKFKNSKLGQEFLKGAEKLFSLMKTSNTADEK